MKTNSRIPAYIVHSIAAVPLLTAQISIAGSATWLVSPQDSAWENANNWTQGGPPNGPSDIATFAQSSQTSVSISTSEEVNSIVFKSESAAYGFSIGVCDNVSCHGQLIISGTGVTNNSSVGQTFEAANLGQVIFNNASTAGSAHMSIVNEGGDFYQYALPGYTIFNDTSSAAGASIRNAAQDNFGDNPGGETIFNGASTADHASISNDGAPESHGGGGQTIFNDTSTAANASIVNRGSGPASTAYPARTIFNGTATAGHATITNYGGDVGGRTIFRDSSTADSATLISYGAMYASGVILFSGASTGGNARVEVFDNAYLDITGHQHGLAIGSIEGSGNVYLGANNLTVGARNISTSFSGVISGTGSLAKIGSGVLTLQANDCIAETVGLILVTGSPIKLDFTGSPDVIASLKINGILKPPGVYGGPMSGAPNILLEFRGPGRVLVGPISTLGNISSRAFVQIGDDVMIGGFIVHGTEPKRVIIRAIGPELTQYGVPNALANPALELHDGTGALIASNDNWQHTIIRGIITENQVRDIMASRLAPRDPRESAIIAELPAGSYSAIVRGVNNTTGVALVEVYDLSGGTDSLLSNISTRSFVQTGDNIMIGGLIVQGAQPKSVIVRAIGPELSAPPFNVPNALSDPTLELHDDTGGLIASNHNWVQTIIGGIITTDQVAAIRASGYAPSDGRESAIIADLPPGNYTAIVRGVNNTTGVALVEVYDLDR